MDTAVGLYAYLRENGFGDYPPLALENAFYAADPAVRGNPGSFNKRLRRLSGPLDEVWRQQIRVMGCLAEFPFIFRTIFNAHTFHYMTPLYATLEVELASLNKQLRRLATETEVAVYYQPFQRALETNVFQLFRSDILQLRPEAERRLERVKARHPEHDWSDTHCDIHWAPLETSYKQTVKALKAAQTPRTSR